MLAGSMNDLRKAAPSEGFSSERLPIVLEGLSAYRSVV